MYKVFIYNKPIYFTENQDIYHSVNQSSIYSCENQHDKEAILNIHKKNPEDKPLYVFNKNIELLWNIFFEDFKEIDAAGGVVVNSNEEVLFIYRNDVWDLPKGKVEKNERIDVAAIREVEEECGISNPKIDKKLITTYHTYATKKRNYIKKTHWYLMHLDTRLKPVQLIPQLEEGITKVIWANENEFDLLLSNTYGSINDVIEAYHSNKN